MVEASDFGEVEDTKCMKVCMQTESVQVSHVAMDLGEGTQHDFFISGLVGKKNLM